MLQDNMQTTVFNGWTWFKQAAQSLKKKKLCGASQINI